MVRPVVFVPGFTCVADDYTEVLPLFGRRTVVVELRGHGRSVGAERSRTTPPRAPVTSAAVIDEVAGRPGPPHDRFPAARPTR